MLIAVSRGASSSLEKLSFFVQSPAWGQFTSEICVTDEFRAGCLCLGCRSSLLPPEAWEVNCLHSLSEEAPFAYGVPHT